MSKRKDFWDKLGGGIETALLLTMVVAPFAALGKCLCDDLIDRKKKRRAESTHYETPACDVKVIEEKLCGEDIQYRQEKPNGNRSRYGNWCYDTIEEEEEERRRREEEEEEYWRRREEQEEEERRRREEEEEEEDRRRRREEEEEERRRREEDEEYWRRREEREEEERRRREEEEEEYINPAFASLKDLL